MARALALVAGVALLYFLGSLAGKLVALPPGYISAVWPSAGIALAAAMLYGPRVLPGVWLGSFASNLLMPTGLAPVSTTALLAMAIATGAVAQAQLGAWLVGRDGFRPQLDRVSDVFRLAVLGGFVACTLNATFGAGALMLAGLTGPVTPFHAWATWWLGDAVGVVLAAPVCLTLAVPRDDDLQVNVAEFVAWLLLAGVVALVAFSRAVELPILLVPLLVWAALRFGERETAIGLAGVGLLAAVTTSRSGGFFERGSTPESLLALDTFYVAMAVPTLVLVAALTERRRAEAELRRQANLFTSIVENIPDMIFVKEAKDLRFVLFNRAGEELVGHPREAMIGKSDRDFFPPDQVEFFIAKDRETLRGRAAIDIPEEPIDTPAGKRWLHTKKVPIVDERGEPVYLLGISEDITELKDAHAQIGRLNDQLAERVAELETTNAEIEAFTYSVSHDLRAPVRAIDGFSEALLEGYEDVLDERGRRYLKLVHDGGRRLGSLIDDMLGLSRVTRRELAPTTVNLSAMAQAIADDLARAEPARRVEWAIAPGLIARGDEGLLRVALVNLLGNAWKFTSKREVAHIQFDRAPQGERPAYVVRDDGAGFDMAYAERLFRPFSRLHTEEEFEGTGIGLATVARVVRRHGGQIWAESAPERGASFYFTLGERAP